MELVLSGRVHVNLLAAGSVALVHDTAEDMASTV